MPYLRPNSLRIVLPAMAALLLAACADDAPVADMSAQNDDPLMSAALGDQIMVDPDLINRNSANRAASFAPQDGSIPLPDNSSQAIAAAQAEALELVGGAMSLRRAPAAERVEGELPPEAILSVASRAASAGEGLQDCAAMVEFSAIWASRMPSAFPVYPRGAVHEAAGTDQSGCQLRVINFTTPVALGDVMDFYFTRASDAGFTVQRAVQDGDDILGGTNNSDTFMVFARALPEGGSSIDLVTSGM